MPFYKIISRQRLLNQLNSIKKRIQVQPYFLRKNYSIPHNFLRTNPSNYPRTVTNQINRPKSYLQTN